MTLADGAPTGIHATAVAIAGRALLIFGHSRAGKSRLAVALIAASNRHRRIVLVGDDRILVRRTGYGLEARPHPRIAGFLERRGLGLVAVPWRERALVAACAMLDDYAAPETVARQNLPAFNLVGMSEADRAAAVLAWWPDARGPLDRLGLIFVSNAANGDVCNW